MDQDPQQYMEVASKGLDVAHKPGLLKSIISWLPPRKQEQTERSVQPVDYRKEAQIALQENAVETLAGLTLTAAEAVQILEPGFTLEDLDKVNSTWQRHWTGGASKVGIDDEERRTWWARLLAGEIQQPETYSLRTLAAMDTLSTKEAGLFTKVCAFIWNPEDPVLILPPDESAHWKPDFSEGTLLESAGLAKFNAVGNFTWGTINAAADDKVVRQSPSYLPMNFNNDAYLIEIPEGIAVTLQCGRLLLTDIGREIYRLVTPSYVQSYRDEIVKEWQKSYTAQRVFL